MGKTLLILLGVILLSACRQQQPAATATSGLKKIHSSDPQTVQSLRQMGVEILVQQPDYLIIRTDSATARKIQTMALAPQSGATERDLVQRLVRIHFADKSQLQAIVNLGVDVWEVEGDSVTARVFDLHLEKLAQQDFTYRILKMNASMPDSVQHENYGQNREEQ
jgi:hypothetical protein